MGNEDRPAKAPSSHESSPESSVDRAAKGSGSGRAKGKRRRSRGGRSKVGAGAQAEVPANASGAQDSTAEDALGKEVKETAAPPAVRPHSAPPPPNRRRLPSGGAPAADAPQRRSLVPRPGEIPSAATPSPPQAGAPHPPRPRRRSEAAPAGPASPTSHSVGRSTDEDSYAILDMSVAPPPPTIDPMMGSVPPPGVEADLVELELLEDLEPVSERATRIDSDAVQLEPSVPPQPDAGGIPEEIPKAGGPGGGEGLSDPSNEPPVAPHARATATPLPAPRTSSRPPPNRLYPRGVTPSAPPVRRSSSSASRPDPAAGDSAAQAALAPPAPASPRSPAVSAGAGSAVTPPPMRSFAAPHRSDNPPPLVPASAEPYRVAEAPAPQPLAVVPSSADTAPTTFSLNASDLAPSRVDPKEQLQLLKEAAQTLVDLCEKQLKLKPEKHRAARLYYEAARLYEDPLGDLPAAAKYFEAACKFAPDHPPSARGLRRVQLRLRRYPQALSSYDAEVKLGGDPAYQAMLLYEKGCLLDDRLSQKGEARAAFEAAVEHDRLNAAVLKAAAHAQEQALAWVPLTKTLEQSANALHDFPELQAAYLSQMARTVAVRLKDVLHAIELYKAAMAADANAPGVLGALKALLYQTGRWGELVAVLEKECQLSQDPVARSLAMFRVGRIHIDRLGDLDAGLKALEHASALAPTDRNVLSELVRVYELAGRYAELATAHERLLALDPSPSAEALHRLGELYDQRLAQHEYAIDRYTRALALQPAYRPSLLNLEKLRTQRGEWAELAQMLANQANASVGGVERAVLFARIADICEMRLGALDHAVDHHKKALQANPGHAASFKALVRLLTNHGKWHELIEIYERRLEQDVTDPERISLLFKIGRLEEDALGLPAAAVSTYKRILEVDENHLEAIECLGRAAERGGRFEELIEALELEAQKISNTSRQLELLHRAAMVADEELAEAGRAVQKLDALLAREPSYMPAIASLAELHHRDEQWEALLATYQRELGVTREAQARSRVEYQMAELCERKLGDDQRAITHYRRAVQAYGRNSEAVWALRRLLTAQGDFKEVVQLLEHEQALVSEPMRVAQLSFLAGELYENRLEAPDKALSCFKAALDVSPDFRPAADACARLLEQKHDYKALADQLKEQLEGATDARQAAQTAYRRGEVLRDHLKQLTEAAKAFEAVLQWQPDHAGALLSLERLYVQLEDHAQLLRLYERQTRSLPGVASQVAAYRAWLRLLERSEDDVEALKNAHVAILNLAPTDAFALFALETIALERSDRAMLQQVDAKLGVARLDRFSTSNYQTRLAEAMEARRDQSALEIYRAALSHDGENLAAARGISRIAERSLSPDLLTEAADNEALLLHDAQEGARLLVLAARQVMDAGDAGSASAKLTAALEMDPDNAEAAQLLTSLMGEGERSGFLVDAISRAAGSASSPQTRAEMWLKVARLHHERTGDNGAAIAAAARAVRECPGDTSARKQLADYYAFGGGWMECAAQLRELLKRNPANHERLSALLLLAAVENDRLKKPAPAEGHAKAALDLSPDNRDALAVLLRVQLAREQLQEAAETAERLASVSVSPKEKAEALYQSAQLERHRDNPDKAERAYIGAVSILGATGDALEEYRKWLEQRGKGADWNAYCRALSSYLEQPDLDAECQRSAYIELGRAMDRHLKDTAGGLQYMRAALEIAPDDEALRSEIAERLERTGQLEAAVDYYLHLVKRQPQYSQHWRALAGCYERLLRIDLAHLALAPVVAHGEASADERSKYQGTPSRSGQLKPGSLSAERLAVVEEGAQVSGPAQDLLKAVMPALPKLYPAPFERYGVNKSDKVTSRSNNSLRHVADRVALVFGVSDFDMYLHDAQPGGVSVALGDPPVLFVGADVAALTEAEQEFVFARVMANIARGLAAVDALKLEGTTRLIVALARQQVAGFAPRVGKGAEMDALPKRISKAMPWFSGGKLEAASRGVAVAGLDVPGWIRNVQVTAARVAAVVCDDLAVAVRCLEREGVGPSTLSEVLTFSFSESSADLRRRLFGR